MEGDGTPTTLGFFLYIFSQTEEKLEYFYQNIIKIITADEAISCYLPQTQQKGRRVMGEV